MPPIITRNHEYAKILSRTVKDNKGFTSLANSATLLDSADVTQIVSGVSVSSMTIYDTYDSLPSSNLTKGNQAYVRATGNMYISDSNRWFSAAFVNLTPTQTLDPAGNVTLSTDGTSTIVTITATDSDQPESQLSYSIESDGNMLATGTTVTQDSSVFTITPLSEDSGGVAGNFTLTFKTTDSVNIASTTKDFSLAFVSSRMTASGLTPDATTWSPGDVETGTVPFYSLRFSTMVFRATDVIFPSSPPSGGAALFENGGAGSGCWVGYKDASTFVCHAGGGSAWNAGTDRTHITFTDFPKDDATHIVEWEFKPSGSGARTRIWIDGVLKGTGTLSGNYASSVPFGANGGGFMVANADASQVSGAPTNNWPNQTSGLLEWAAGEITA